MPGVGCWLDRVLAYWRAKRDEDLDWRLERQPQVEALRQSRVLAEQERLAQLKIKAQQLQHELALNEAKQRTELEMVKIQCRQDLQDYQQYLQSLDDLKRTLRASYAHLPEAVAFTIHHHAKQLLNKMWEAEDPQEKLKSELQLIQFMTAVHEDSQFSLQQQQAPAVPQKTLAFIDNGR